MTLLDNYKKQNGIVYTPKLLSSHLSNKAVYYFLKGKSNDEISSINIKILDPACGNGELLYGIWKSLENHEKLKDLITEKKLKPEDVLYGVDIELDATNQTQNRINQLSLKSDSENNKNTLHRNSLVPLNGISFDDAWKNFLLYFNALEGFDIIIANPPWGADIKSYHRKIDSDYFQLAKGNLIPPICLLNYP